MTINYSRISDNIRRYRLPFGVPLEDISPERQLHPYLKKIFIKAFHDITLNGHSIEDVTCKLQGNVAERLILKEIVTSCKPMPLEFPPGALLWILRHFIGLLPVPLLPEYTNKEYLSWRRLSVFCKRSFMKYATIETNNRLLIRKLAAELGRLPTANFLLFSVLLNFIRALSHEHKKYGKANFNKIAAFCLVKYFSSSIFTRPFVPGRNGKIDRHYFPLLFYLVLKWPEIEKYFGRHYLINKIPAKEILTSNGYYSPSSARKIKIKDSYAQTEDNIEYYDWLETISEESFDESVNFLRDIACQTENCLTKFKNSEFSFPNEYGSDGSIDFLRDTACQTEDSLARYAKIRCCCMYGRNYRSFLYEKDSLDKDCQTISFKNLDEDKSEGKLFDGNSIRALNEDINSHRESLLCETNPFLSKYCQTSFVQDIFKESTVRTTNKRSISTITGQDLLYTDTQTQLNLDSLLKNDIGTNTDYPAYYGWTSPTISSKSPRNKLDFCSPQTFLSENEYIYDDYAESTLNLLGKNIDRSHSKDEDLLGRISKIGWTYTPPRSACVASPIESPVATSKTTMKEENYTLCFNDKEGHSKEEKESCSSRGSLKSGGSVVSAKSKKSFSITNLKNKLDFLKFFTGKRKKLKNSCSFSEISNIKYKKMNSVKSTLF